MFFTVIFLVDNNIIILISIKGEIQLHVSSLKFDYLQHIVLIPGRIESLWFVACVVSGVGVGREIESTEGVAQPRYVLSTKIPCSVNLQVTLQIGFLEKCIVLVSERTLNRRLLLRSLFLCRWKERDIYLSINIHLKEDTSPLS